MASVETTVPVDEASISAVVIRCGCPPGEMDHPDAPCYRPRSTEDRGVISYYSRNPIKRALWALRRKSWPQ